MSSGWDCRDNNGIDGGGDVASKGWESSDGRMTTAKWKI